MALPDGASVKSTDLNHYPTTPVISKPGKKGKGKGKGKGK
jgi:hypothetical protein